MVNPVIKVDWVDVPENITPEKIKRVKTYFQNKYNAKNVKVVPTYLSNDMNTRLKSLEASDNILDPQYQKKLVKDFIQENKIEIKWDLINRLDDKVNNNIDETNQKTVRYNKWEIKKVEFSNFLSFGQKNVIDFTELGGITVIESTPKNFGGKSVTSIDLLMFLFFNSTTKTKINEDIFNKFTDVDEVKVDGYINIDNVDYLISRTLTRKRPKAGGFKVTSKLEFSEFDDSGELVNLSGEQRRETEKIITEAIGTQEDFLLTILTTGNNLEELIDSKPTARGQILTRFLGLESLKEKEEVAKKMFNDWSKTLLSNTHNVMQLKIDNGAYNTNIENSKYEIKNLEKQLKIDEDNLEDLETKRDKLLSSMNNDISDDLINTNPVLVQREIDELVEKRGKIKELGKGITVTEPSEYYLEDDHEKVKKEISNLNLELNLNLGTIKSSENLIVQFETGKICPTCKQPLADVDHSEEIKELKDTVIKLKNRNTKLENKIKSLEEDEEKLSSLKKIYDEYEKDKLRKSKNELEFEQKSVEIDNKTLLLERYESSKKKLEENKLIEAEAVKLKTHIETVNADIKQGNINIERYKNNIITMEEKIKINDELIKKIDAEQKYVVVFKTYLSIYGKNGISKIILKNMIPLINQELQRILSDSCEFILELTINEKNELDFLMIDNDTRVVKPLVSGSGYEKTIASLALRSVLTKVSSLPKPNVVVMDEVFGKIADENLELVGEFFIKIKSYFEHILLISHNPLIRNWSDNIIMIKKDDNVSSIDFINTKIT